MANHQAQSTKPISGGEQELRRKKNPQLSKDAGVHKRPLQRPPIVSSFASQEHTKFVYLSAKTPFMSAVKRIEKLLARSEKRAVQSASSVARSAPKHQRQTHDEIVEIAKNLHAREDNESVVAKGSGKAIQKAMEVGLWFQNKPHYAVKLITASIKVVDDIHNDTNKSTTDDTLPDAGAEPVSVFDLDQIELDEETHHTRTRQLNVLEVHIKLR